jgi:phage baseplate assembly protein W
VRALNQWEPRLKLERIVVVSVLGGKINFKISGEYLGERGTLEVWV